jgi:hypothetical protein
MKHFALFIVGFLCGCAIGWQETTRLFHKLYAFFAGMF